MTAPHFYVSIYVKVVHCRLLTSITRTTKKSSISQMSLMEIFKEVGVPLVEALYNQDSGLTWVKIQPYRQECQRGDYIDIDPLSTITRVMRLSPRMPEVKRVLLWSTTLAHLSLSERTWSLNTQSEITWTYLIVIVFKISKGLYWPVSQLLQYL